jgi:hypothetical protein
MAPSHGVSLHDLGAEVDYDPLARHGESKLANILHADEITRRYGVEGGDGVVGVAVHQALADTTPRTSSTMAGMGRKALHFLAHPTGHGDAHHSQQCPVSPNRPRIRGEFVPRLHRDPRGSPQTSRFTSRCPRPSMCTTLSGIADERPSAQGASMALLAALQSGGGRSEEARAGPGPHVHDRAHDAGLAQRLWEMSERAVAAVVTAVEDSAEATIGVGLTPPPPGSPFSPSRPGRRPHHAHHHAPGVAAAPAADPVGARVG